MPYLRAVLKEALRWVRELWGLSSDDTETKGNNLSLFCRMYPVVPMNARIISDKDVSIGGYQFSKKVGLLFVFVYMNYNIKRKDMSYRILTLDYHLSRLPSHCVTMPSVTMRTLSQNHSHLSLRDGSVMVARDQTHLALSHLASEWEAVSAAGLLSLRCIWFCFE